MTYDAIRETTRRTVTLLRASLLSVASMMNTVTRSGYLRFSSIA
jgi:hypothetical protein